MHRSKLCITGARHGVRCAYPGDNNMECIMLYLAVGHCIKLVLIVRTLIKVYYAYTDDV